MCDIFVVKSIANRLWELYVCPSVYIADEITTAPSTHKFPIFLVTPSTQQLLWRNQSWPGVGLLSSLHLKKNLSENRRIIMRLPSPPKNYIDQYCRLYITTARRQQHISRQFVPFVFPRCLCVIVRPLPSIKTCLK